MPHAVHCKYHGPRNDTSILTPEKGWDLWTPLTPRLFSSLARPTEEEARGTSVSPGGMAPSGGGGWGKGVVDGEVSCRVICEASQSAEIQTESSDLVGP